MISVFLYWLYYINIYYYKKYLKVTNTLLLQDLQRYLVSKKVNTKSCVGKFFWTYTFALCSKNGEIVQNNWELKGQRGTILLPNYRAIIKTNKNKFIYILFEAMQLLNICTIFWNLESTVLCISSYHAIVSSAIHTNQGGVDKKKKVFWPLISCNFFICN